MIAGRIATAGDRRGLRRVGLRLGLLFGVLIGWQAAGNETVRIALPTATRTAGSFVDLVASGKLLEALLLSNQAMLGGYLVTLAVSLPLGILMGTQPAIRRLAEPYLTLLLAVPMIALIPVVQAVFGLTLGARIVIVFLFAFVYVTTNTMVGIKSVDDNLIEMGRAFNASRIQLLTRVRLPAAVPGIMAGIRLGLGRAVVGMVVSELFLVGAGLGNLLVAYRARFETAYVFALALTMIIEGIVLMEIARRVEGRFNRAWQS